MNLNFPAYLFAAGSHWFLGSLKVHALPGGCHGCLRCKHQ